MAGQERRTAGTAHQAPLSPLAGGRNSRDSGHPTSSYTGFPAGLTTTANFRGSGAEILGSRKSHARHSPRLRVIRPTPKRVLRRLDFDLADHRGKGAHGCGCQESRSSRHLPPRFPDRAIGLRVRNLICRPAGHMVCCRPRLADRTRRIRKTSRSGAVAPYKISFESFCVP